MKHQKPLAVTIFIRICVVFMVVSLIWVYVVYMFTPQQPTGNDEWINNFTGNTWWVVEILPEIDSENPESTSAPILVTEDWEIDEMDQTLEVQLENGQTEFVRLWDLTDAVQIN